MTQQWTAEFIRLFSADKYCNFTKKYYYKENVQTLNIGPISMSSHPLLNYDYYLLLQYIMWIMVIQAEKKSENN